MPIVKQFELNICVDDEPVKEYNDDENEEIDDSKVRKYIEACPGSEFALEFNVKKGYNFTEDYLSWDIQLDGQLILEPVIDSSDFTKSEGAQDSRNGIKVMENSKWVLKKFLFSSVETCE